MSDQENYTDTSTRTPMPWYFENFKYSVKKKKFNIRGFDYSQVVVVVILW